MDWNIEQLTFTLHDFHRYRMCEVFSSRTLESFLQ